MCGCTSDGKEVNGTIGDYDAHIRVGSARKRPLAAQGIGAWQLIPFSKFNNYFLPLYSEIHS